MEEETATHWETGEQLISFRNPLRFQGQYEDEESGLFYNLNRYYQPELGRYITQDPVKLAGGLNQYAYVGGNPVSWVDPEGLFKVNNAGGEQAVINNEVPHLPQTGSGTYSGNADEVYDLIRASESDVADISRNTRIKEVNIQKVKDHLFYNEHLLDRYESYGMPATTGRFDSDVGIANAWLRLIKGEHTELDIRLLRHETAESWYMRKHGPGYSKAHEAA
ncbi:RHS repeat-associated core domain-containing protein, partial [Salmonella enterica]|nr:RHS repeat-associated core domain-containing protein [Salmonella enterica]